MEGVVIRHGNKTKAVRQNQERNLEMYPIRSHKFPMFWSKLTLILFSKDKVEMRMTHCPG